jgi:hypothetical protein
MGTRYVAVRRYWQIPFPNGAIIRTVECSRRAEAKGNCYGRQMGILQQWQLPVEIARINASVDFALEYRGSQSSLPSSKCRHVLLRTRSFPQYQMSVAETGELKASLVLYKDIQELVCADVFGLAGLSDDTRDGAER